MPTGRLSAHYVSGLAALVGVADLELDDFSLREGAEPFSLDRREVDEDVFTIRLLDEAVPFRVVEPFYGPLHTATSTYGVD